MAGGVGVRCYSLCVSFQYVQGSRTIFGAYFLIPIGLALALVWLEIAIAARRRGAMVLASFMPLALVLLAPAGFRDEPVYLRFLDLFQKSLGGSPFFVALVLVAALHVYAALRKVPLSWELLTFDLAALGAVGPTTFTFHEIAGMRPLPLAAAGLVLGNVAWRHRGSGRAAVAACLIAAAVSQACANLWPAADSSPIAVHVIIVAFLAVGAFFDDWLGRFMQLSACVACLVLGVFSAVQVSAIINVLPAKFFPWYPLCIAVTTLCYAFWVRNPRLFGTPVCVLVTWAGYSGLENYSRLRRVVTGLDHIVLGLVLFLVAAAISLTKAGLLPHLSSGKNPARRALDRNPRSGARGRSAADAH